MLIAKLLSRFDFRHSFIVFRFVYSARNFELEILSIFTFLILSSDFHAGRYLVYLFLLALSPLKLARFKITIYTNTFGLMFSSSLSHRFDLYTFFRSLSITIIVRECRFEPLTYSKWYILLVTL